MTKQEKQNKTSQQEDRIQGIRRDLIDLQQHRGYKYLVEMMDQLAKGLIQKILTPCTDQSIKFNADHLLKERLAVVTLIKSYVDGEISMTEEQLKTLREGEKPILQRLEEQDKKLAKELRSRMEALGVDLGV